MRTLHADLTTAQQSASATPYMKLVFDSYNRATTRTYQTTDSPNRIVQVMQGEGRFGSHTLAEGLGFAVSSIIRLQNSDNALSNLDFNGYRVYVEWGFDASGTNRASRSGPEFVVSQEFVSTEGINYLELYTLSLWELANQMFVNVGNALPLTFTAGGANETKVSHILMELLGGGVLGSAQQDDGGVFTDYTSESEDTGTAFGIFPATPVVNDAFYFGKTDKFDRITLDITQILSSGSVTIAWEYSRGSSAWGTLVVLTQAEGATALSHLDLTATGIQIEAFNVPSDWATDTVNSVASTYWIRARVSAVSSPVTQIQATRAFAGQDFAFALDTSEGTQGDDYLPTYRTNVGSQLGSVMSDIMGYTLMGLRVQEDGFHAAFVDAAQASPDATYILTAGPHHFFTHTEGQQVTIPNRVLVVNSNLDLGVADYSGQDDDNTSQAAIGIIPRITVATEVGSDAAAAILATRILTQLQRDKVQGRVEVPMHCGQEVWDEVRVQDDRSGNTVDGRVSQIIRLYSAGEYTMQVVMGGGIRAAVVPDYPVVTEYLGDPAWMFGANRPDPMSPAPGQVTPYVPPSPAPAPSVDVPAPVPVPVPTPPSQDWQDLIPTTSPPTRHVPDPVPTPPPPKLPRGTTPAPTPGDPIPLPRPRPRPMRRP